MVMLVSINDDENDVGIEIVDDNAAVAVVKVVVVVVIYAIVIFFVEVESTSD